MCTAIPYRVSTGPEQGFPCVLFTNREKPVFITGIAANENRFFPVGKSTQGNPCFHYRDGFAVHHPTTLHTHNESQWPTATPECTMCWHKDIAKFQILMKTVLNQCLGIQYERRVANLYLFCIFNENFIDSMMTLLPKIFIFCHFYLVKF